MFYTPPALALDPQQYFSEPKPPRDITPNHTLLVRASPFAECPQDIARLIFEMAIMSRPLLPIQLTLVCRQVKEWSVTRSSKSVPQLRLNTCCNAQVGSVDLPEPQLQ